MNDNIFYLLIGLLVAMFFAALLIAVTQFIHRFSKELRYINMEIGRASGEEKKYWIRRRRRLWFLFFRL